jgi:uncharacterized protein
MTQFIALITVLLVFSLVQSLFGMGLLVFGTPTLLLMGYTFSQSLAYLLPPSITISLLQVLKNRNIDRKLAGNFIIYCLPFICICLSIYLYTNIRLKLEFFIAFVLLLNVLLRCVPTLEKKMQRVVQSNQKIFLIIMGCIHGFSNMGGGLLSVFASSQYTTKEQILRCVSFCQLFFGIAPLTILLIFEPQLFSPKIIWFCLAAGSIYITVGKSLFSSSSQYFYRNLFTGFMVLYAGLLIVKGIGLI